MSKNDNKLLRYLRHAVYQWPVTLHKSLDRWITNFIWSGDVNTKNVCTVAWKTVCLHWEAGGLNLKSTNSINDSLILHLSWKLMTEKSQWLAMFMNLYFSFGQPTQRQLQSSVWPSIKTKIGFVIDDSLWLIGDGNCVSLWHDSWLGVPLVDLLDIPPNLGKHLFGTLNSLIKDGCWHLPPEFPCQPDIMSRIKGILLPITPLDDQLVWRHSLDGLLSAKLAFNFLIIRPLRLFIGLTWFFGTAFHLLPPLLFGALYTINYLRTRIFDHRGCVVVSICVLTSHLFLQCPFAVSIWAWLEAQCQCIFDGSSLSSLLKVVPRMCSSQNLDIFGWCSLYSYHLAFR